MLISAVVSVDVSGGVGRKDIVWGSPWGKGWRLGSTRTLETSGGAGCVFAGSTSTGHMCCLGASFGRVEVDPGEGVTPTSVTSRVQVDEPVRRLNAEAQAAVGRRIGCESGKRRGCPPFG